MCRHGVLVKKHGCCCNSCRDRQPVTANERSLRSMLLLSGTLFLQEYHQQGDMEKKLGFNVSALTDRDKSMGPTQVPK